MNKCLPFLIALLLMATGCRKKNFTLEFDLSPDIEASYSLLYYASDSRGGRWIESAAPVHLGKFAMECPAINPTVVYVFRSGNTLPESFFYAERGDKITITGNGQDPRGWEFKGNKITERLSDWQSANRKALESGSPAEINKAVASFVEKNPKSEIDPLILLCRYDRNADPEGFVRLWNMMEPGLRKKSFGELTSMPDLYSLAPLTFDDKGTASLAPGKDPVRKIAVRRLNKGSGQLSLPKGKPSLLCFWHVGDPRRSEMIDTLRSLSKQFPDSGRFLMAAICLDYDSLRWSGTVRHDSVPHLVDGWWPRGTSDPEAVRLGIGAYRTFLVVSPSGKVAYKGDSIDVASRHLRTLLKQR